MSRRGKANLACFSAPGEGSQLWDPRGHFDEGRESIANIPVSELDLESSYV